MISDAQTHIIVTQSHLLPTLSTLQVEAICLDSDWSSIAQHAIENLPCRISPSNAAYIIYTSGSTGKPKGVIVEHLSALNLIFALRQLINHYHRSHQLRASLNAPLIFDASVKQLLLLLLGHTLFVLPQEIRADGGALVSFIKANGLEVLDCTPSQLELMLAAGLIEQQETALAVVLVGGEKIQEQTWQTLSQTRNTTFYNVYGPTECTVDATISPILATIETPTIGRPIANCQVYILDQHLALLPSGAVGELYIAGMGVARGYLGYPVLTAERFLPHPFSSLPGARIYKTGDMARFRPDGTIEFIGRNDHQVKIRDQRIELEEVESALGTYKGLRACAVRAWGDTPHDRLLAAYLVPKQRPFPTMSELRQFLIKKLPEHMIPSIFIPLEALPLTVNGKIDRKALPVPDQDRLSPGNTFVSPHTPVEEVLAGIWSMLLKLERVGIHDNFFELGGHSLLATQLVSRLREHFQVEISLRMLFEAPTIAELAEKVEQVMRSSRGLLAPPLRPVPRHHELPLSFAQQRLWFLNQLEPDSSAYNIPLAVRLQGHIRVAVLVQVIDELIRRHEILRTSIPSIEGRPHLLVMPVLKISIPLVDLSNLHDAQCKEALQQLVNIETQRPFDLIHGPVLRTLVFQMQPHDFILLITIHHIACDGWSISVLVREMLALYESFSKGEPSPLPELAIQYADFASWQRQWLKDEILEMQLAYWRQRLAGATTLALPTDRPRPAIQSFRGALHSFPLPSPLAKRLRSLSLEQGTTLFMTLLGAFQFLLYRYSGQNDIVVGTDLAGRTQPHTEALIGCFINQVVIRTNVNDSLSFVDLLKQVHELSLEAFMHQDLPFDKLVEAMRINRTLSRMPLFQILFILQNTPERSLELPGVSMTPLELGETTAKYDLTLSVRETNEGLLCTLEYSTDLFHQDTAIRMSQHYCALLEGITAHPQQPLSSLSLLSREEQNQVLREWNDTATTFQEDQCLHHYFEKWAGHIPDAIAAVYGEEYITYDELNRRANQLGHYLQIQGVGPEVIVGICMARSITCVISLLAILKAGGAFLPLDPTYPRERLAFMLHDAHVEILLMSESAANRLPEDVQRKVCIEAEWSCVSEQSAANVSAQGNIDNLAYVSYTSGSTGRPKGVQGTHRPFIHRFNWMWQAYPFTAGEVGAHKTSLNFLDSIWEIFGTLGQGARIVIISEETVKDPQELVYTLSKYHITRMVLVPSLLRAIIETHPDLGHKLPGLGLWVSSGEPISLDLFNLFREVKPEAVLLNLYGATEIAADVTCYNTHSLPEAVRVVPIGRPISNTQIYILDEQLQPVPVGVVGEICVGGSSLSRGYLNHPEYTAEKFVPNPFSVQTGARLYRTGDLGRYLSSGDIEFIGRRDYQVKIRGYRIELAEIEDALAHHPAVQRCVVVARENVAGDKRLIGYVVFTPMQSLTSSAIRTMLKEKLPEYMIPAIFVPLEALPLTPSGKIDRQALPAPEQTRPALAVDFVPPRSPLERTLVEIWSQILDVAQVGVLDNFFDLGGHSLQAVQLVSRISTRVKQEISVKTLFLHPTISTLAAEMERHKVANGHPAGRFISANKLAPATMQPLIIHSPYLRLERRPLLPLFVIGEIAPVQAASITYLPNFLFEQSGLTQDEIIHAWCDNLPFVSAIYGTYLGRIAIITIPRFLVQLYDDKQDLLALLRAGMRMARTLGAQTISLMGLLPSATDYGRDLPKEEANEQQSLRITTGHATTAAGILLTIKNTLEMVDRDITQEKVGFLGLGSIGLTTLHLILEYLPHPAEIYLCDLYSKQSLLEALQQELRAKWGYQGKVSLVASQAKVPACFYEATTIIGATNVANVLETRLLRPGTMIIDDSAPHCFDTESLAQRFEAHRDILFTDGGMLQAPQPISQLRYIPEALEREFGSSLAELAKGFNPNLITGCVLSSLLSTRFAHLLPTTGLVSAQRSFEHYITLRELGFRSAELHAGNYILNTELIQQFRSRFGRTMMHKPTIERQG